MSIFAICKNQTCNSVIPVGYQLYYFCRFSVNYLFIMYINEVGKFFYASIIFNCVCRSRFSVDCVLEVDIRTTLTQFRDLDKKRLNANPRNPVLLSANVLSSSIRLIKILLVSQVEFCGWILVGHCTSSKQKRHIVPSRRYSLLLDNRPCT